MTELTSILLFTAGAGLALPAGGLIARFESLRPEWLEQEFRHSVLAFGGGILYLVFQDIAPQAKLSRHWGPPLGAVLGFALGLIAELVQGG